MIWVAAIYAALIAAIGAIYYAVAAGWFDPRFTVTRVEGNTLFLAPGVTITLPGNDARNGYRAGDQIAIRRWI